MMNLKESFAKLRPILEDYANQKNLVQKKLTQQGILSKEICNECRNKEIYKIIKFDENMNNSIPDFIDWIISNKIKSISSDKENIQFTSNERVVEKRVGELLKFDTDVYIFKLPISKLKKNSFVNLFNFEFKKFSFCGHLTTETYIKSLPIIIHKIPYFFNNINSMSQDPTNIFEKDKKIKELKLICRNCYDRIDKVGCETIRERGFIYETGHCRFESVLLKNLLKKHNIKFIDKETEFYYAYSFEYFLPEFNILITKNTTELNNVIEKLNPEIILGFGKQQDIVNFLQYNSNIIIFDDSERAQQRFFLFDKNKRVEDSIEKIILYIVSKLNKYSEQIGGKEHDRLKESFFKIGQDLGFIPQKELPHKGSRVDVVWLDRKGNVFVAIEIETSAQWKKDVVSTWETEPKLAIIVSHYTTEKGIKNILQYVLLENMPHKLFFINNLTKKAYLIERNSVLKYYDLIEKKEVKPTSDTFEY